MAYETVKVDTPLVLRILPVASVVAFFGIWQGVVDFGIVPNTMLASPTQVAVLFWEKLFVADPDGAVLSVHAWVSIQEAFTGFFLSLLVGIPLGLMMGWFNVAEGLARPIFELIRPIPPVAWIPLTIFWFGIGIPGKVFIIWLSGIVPCVINSYVGVRMTSPTLIQMARTYGATDWEIFKKICIPSALPMVFGAMTISQAYCWTTLVGAEYLAADQGLGYLITMGRRLASPPMVVLGMICVGLTGVAIGIVIERLEKKLLAGIRR
ncbi:MAG: ABC transporter permease [Desulfobacteraceae bacterium]|nr:ABC transporter permease [Desulfobacteraceae bacterium]